MSISAKRLRHYLAPAAGPAATISDCLLYSSLLLGSSTAAAAGLALSPALWDTTRVSRRHVALAAGVMLAAAGWMFFSLDQSLLSFQGRFNVVRLTPSFALRRTALPLLLLVSRRRPTAWVALSANVACVVALFLWLQVLGGRRADAESVGYACLGIAALTELINGWVIFAAPEEPANLPHRAGAALAGAFALAASVTLTTTRTGSSVAVWWPIDSPSEFSRVSEGHGWQNIGQYGELPEVLRSAGFNVTHVNHFSTLVDEQVVVLPPLLDPLPISDVNALRDYVFRGGRLLLVAEHSNLGGVMDSGNAILAGTGLEIRFDTTNALFGDGTYAFEGEGSRYPYLVHNRGASLAVTGSRARPLLVGTWWHSDAGDVLAPERAYLSDYRLSSGDIVGNLVLAAEASFGRGRVVVWGDGSPFLNQNLVYDSQFLAATLSELAGSRVAWLGPVLGAVSLAIWAAMDIPAVFILAGLVAAIPWPTIGPKPHIAPIAVISDAENNGFNRNPSSDFSVTGLGVVLTRAGWVPSLQDWRSLPENARLVFIINPHRYVSKQFAALIRRRAAHGTTVVLAGGGDNRTFVRLIQEFGCRTGGVPVGSIKGDTITTYSAWQLSCSTGNALTAGDTQIGSILPIEQGRIIVIADSGFLLSKNLETESTFDLNNEKLLQTLLPTP